MSSARWEWLLAQADQRGFDWDAHGGCFRHRSERRLPVTVHGMLETIDPEPFLDRRGELRSIA